MMPNPNSPIELSLMGADDSDPLLAHFASVCNGLLGALRHIERCVTGDFAEIEYEVVGLSKNSPATVKVRAPKSAVHYPEVHTIFDESILAVQEGRRLDPRLDYQAIRSLRPFGWPLKKPGVALHVDGVDITPRFNAELTRLLEPDFSSHGSITGMLEAITMHGRDVFTLYPPIRREEVACQFNRKEQLPRVLAALGKHVTVYGILYFAKGQSCPVKVDVDDFEQHPDDAELPSAMDLLGINAGNGVDSVMAVRERRDEWD